MCNLCSEFVLVADGENRYYHLNVNMAMQGYCQSRVDLEVTLDHGHSVKFSKSQ
jgi:hypothetical protein